MLNTSNTPKPVLSIPIIATERRNKMYTGLNRSNIWAGRCRTFFIPAREIITEIISRPLTTIESVARSIDNLAKSSFSQDHCVKNSVFYLEQAIANALDTPLIILTAPLQYIHQIFAVALNPTKAQPSENIEELSKTNLLSKKWFCDLQDSLYSNPESIDSSPLVIRLTSPLTALADVSIDVIAPLAASIENLFYNAIKQLLGSLTWQKDCSLKKALYYVNQSRQEIANTGAALVMSPIKFVYQVFAISYDPKNVASIQNFLFLQKKEEPILLETDEKNSRATTPLPSSGPIEFFNSSEIAVSDLVLQQQPGYIQSPDEESLQTILPRLPKEKLQLISPEQITNLDLSELKEVTLSFMFEYKQDDLKEKERQTKRIEAINIKLQTTLPRLPREALQLISPEQITGLNLSQLEESILSDMFDYSLDDLEEKERQTKRIEAININQLKVILPLLPKEALQLISPNQIKNLNLSELEKITISCMFSPQSTDLKEKERQTKRIQAINENQLPEILPQLPINTLSLISTDQIKSLNLTNLSNFHLFKMFYYEPDDSEEKNRQAERFANISPKSLMDLSKQNKLHPSFRELLSKEQKNLTLKFSN